MADEDAFLDEVALLWEEEGLFARDVDGQLVRMEKATESDYTMDITMKIDGQEITVKKARPSTDSQGNILFDQNGRTVPRLTTIYDAADELFVKQQGGTNPIPILCHQEHMHPAGVCRVCSVEVCRMKGDREVPGGKLLPACHHPVKPDMIVHTIDSPQEESSVRMRRAIKVLGELLASDHLHKEESNGVPNELEVLTDRMGCETKRFTPRERHDRGRDNSSQLISVDHNSCILCNRCIRACTEIKENKVIGRTGKGYTATIGFDLNNKMADSSCVSCGECMVSCPTDALTFRNPVISDWYKEELKDPANTEVTVEELKQHRLFKAISHKWLQWNVASVIRRTVKKGDVLCRLGEYGATAFILNKGSFGVWLQDPYAGQLIKTRKKRNFLQRLFGASPRIDNDALGRGKVPPGDPLFTMTPEDLIVGEMTCMSDQPRTGTIAAMEDGEIFEIRRNVLYVLQRNAVSREELDSVYRQRALFSHLKKISLFAELSKGEQDECVNYLKDRVDLIRVDPGQNIFRQGEAATDFYMVRLGHVKVHQSFLGQEQVLAYLRPDTHFGEIGLVSNFPELIEELQKQEVPEYLWRRRTASCTALDDVELVRVKGRDFFELTKKFPALKDRFIEHSRQILSTNKEKRKKVDVPIDEFLDQGLFNAQRLLVIDLEACTRCDECTRACADTHGGVTRLVRDGLRYDKFLVASACRSCTDPYCLVGCPVDSIHRDDSLEIIIENHCIGCGQCANNCPYGNINMHGMDPVMPTVESDDGKNKHVAVVQQKATTCDLCRNVVGEGEDVSCVYACPHNAAFRMTGPALFDTIKANAN
ncbi:MAG: cyclic nucleotide-binding protein [Planctomycetaceae bacterium]|nr:cyclic nucleotide-binding protein [Planctomycetaceae bacterium]